MVNCCPQHTNRSVAHGGCAGDCTVILEMKDWPYEPIGPENMLECALVASVLLDALVEPIKEVINCIRISKLMFYS